MKLTDIAGREYEVNAIFAKLDGKLMHITEDMLDLLFTAPETKPEKPERVIAQHKKHNFLTKQQVVEIKAALAAGQKQKDIAKDFDASQAVISRIAHNTHSKLKENK